MFIWYLGWAGFFGMAIVNYCMGLRMIKDHKKAIQQVQDLKDELARERFLNKVQK